MRLNGRLVLTGVAMCVWSTAGLAEGTARLSTADRLEIEQLGARYAQLVDACANSGDDYADLFTADGTFGVKDDWDGQAVVWAKGREALAKAGGGGPDGCRPKKPGSPGYGLHHIVTSQVVTPSADGAIGRSVLITLGVDGTPGSVEWQGGYQDVYVRTPKGWRIKSRYHVWPNARDSIQFKTFPLPEKLLPPARSAPVR